MRFMAIAMPLLFTLSCHVKDLNPKGLETYAGKDLRKLDEGALLEFHRQLEKLTGDKPEKLEWGSFEPWWVKPFAVGTCAWALLEAYPGYNVPDVSAIQVHVFDKNWNRLIKQSFATGYRFFLSDVSVLKDNPLKQDLLVAKVTSAGPFIVQGNEKMKSGPPSNKETSNVSTMASWATSLSWCGLRTTKGRLFRTIIFGVSHRKVLQCPSGNPKSGFVVSARTIRQSNFRF